MLLGYARVSTKAQLSSLEHQEDALRAHGCERVWTEVASGRKGERNQLAELLTYARDGDTVVVTNLSRLGRRTVEILSTIEGLEERGIGFTSLQEQIDTRSPAGKVLLAVVASLCAAEAQILEERVRAGLRAAAAAGRKGGRRPVLTREQCVEAKTRVEAGESVSVVARSLGVSRATVYRAAA